MELHLLVLRERKSMISGAADLDAAARHGAGFYTQPNYSPFQW